MELTRRAQLLERGILQNHAPRRLEDDDDDLPVRFDGAPTPVKPAPLLGEHTAVSRSAIGLVSALRKWRRLREDESF